MRLKFPLAPEWGPTAWSREGVGYHSDGGETRLKLPQPSIGGRPPGRGRVSAAT